MKPKTKASIITAVVAVAINVISSIIYSLVQDVDFATAFIELWKIIIDFIVSVLSFKITIWQLLIGIFLFVLALLIYESKTKKNEQEIPDFMQYTSGIYKGINYHWELDRYSNTLRINNIQPICDCGSFLTTKRNYRNAHYGQPKLYCVNCDKIIEPQFDQEILEDAKLYFGNILNKKIKDFYSKRENKD